MIEANLNSIAARIERLPLGKFHRRFIALVSLGGWFDFYDIYMMAYIGAALQQSRFLTLEQFSAVIAAGFLGMFTGTILFGMGSDRMGRRSAFVAMLLIYSLFTLAGAFAPSANWLIVLRFFAGIGIGAELVVIDTYVSEMVPSAARGRYVAITQTTGFTAVPIAAILVRLLVPTHFWIEGWRWVMVLGSLGSALAWYFRRRLPESPRWLESRGRHQEAEQVVVTLESESLAGQSPRAISLPASSNTATPGCAPAARTANPSVRHSVPLAPSAHVGSVTQPAISERASPAERASFAELWRPPYRRRTIMLIIFHTLQTIGYYGFANWAPTFLLRRGVSLLHSLDYTLLIALVSPLGPALAVLTSDKLERKWTIVAMALLIAALGLGFAFWSLPALIVLSGALVTLCSNWFSALLHAYQSELFPTRMRATGVGFTYSWSRLSASCSSLLIGVVLLRGGVGAVFTLLAAAMCGVALVIGVFGPRTNRISLEQLAR
jgi:MFS transporter, putative metabolite:H+ symporter